MPSTKKQLYLRVSDEGAELLDALRRHLGLNSVGVVELALRRLAEIERVKPEGEEGRRGAGG
jgi:hypothetical protein